MKQIASTRAHIQKLKKGQRVRVSKKEYPVLMPGEKAILYHQYDDSAMVYVRVHAHPFLFWCFVFTPTQKK